MAPMVDNWRSLSTPETEKKKKNCQRKRLENFFSRPPHGVSITVWDVYLELCFCLSFRLADALKIRTSYFKGGGLEGETRCGASPV